MKNGNPTQAPSSTQSDIALALTQVNEGQYNF